MPNPLTLSVMADKDSALPVDRAVAANAVEPVPVSPVPASIPSAARPKRYDAEILKSAAAEVAAACVEWDDGQSEPDEWIDDLVRCWFHWDDGYKLAKALEDRCGVDADMALAEALDSASHALWTAHEAAIRKWVSEHEIAPPLAVGSHVHTTRGDGVIGSIDLERAIYLVVPYGEEERFKRGGGWCIAYEDAQAIEARRAATLGAVHESAVPERDASNTGSNQDQPHDQR